MVVISFYLLGGTEILYIDKMNSGMGSRFWSLYLLSRVCVEFANLLQGNPELAAWFSIL